MKDFEVTAIFHQDTTGTFRFMEGGKTTNRKITWRFIGDSLRISHVGETPPQVNFRMYAITKDPSGYLLKGQNEQMLLTESK